MANKKIHDHNGKELKSRGKNIRITTPGWEKIRKFCIKNGLVMGVFVESSALGKINLIKGKSSATKK